MVLSVCGKHARLLSAMSGAFVTFHNTSEIFGFEYIPLTKIDRLLFGAFAGVWPS